MDPELQDTENLSLKEQELLTKFHDQLSNPKTVAGFSFEILTSDQTKKFHLDPNRIYSLLLATEPKQSFFHISKKPRISDEPIFIGTKLASNTTTNTTEKQGLLLNSRKELCKALGVSEKFIEPFKKEMEVWDRNFQVSLTIAQSLWKDSAQLADQANKNPKDKNLQQFKLQPFLGIPRAFMDITGKGREDVLKDVWDSVKYLVNLDANQAKTLWEKAISGWSKLTLPGVRNIFNLGVTKLGGIAGSYPHESFWTERTFNHLFREFWVSAKIGKKLAENELGSRVFQTLKTQIDDYSYHRQKIHQAIDKLKSEAKIDPSFTYANRVETDRRPDYLKVKAVVQGRDRDLRKLQTGKQQVADHDHINYSLSPPIKARNIIRVWTHNKFTDIYLPQFADFNSTKGFVFKSDGEQKFQTLINNIYYQDNWGQQTALPILENGIPNTMLQKRTLGNIVLYQDKAELARYSADGALARKGEDAFSLTYQVDKETNILQEFRSYYGHVGMDGQDAQELLQQDLAKFSQGDKTGWQEDIVFDEDEAELTFKRSSHDPTKLEIDEIGFRQNVYKGLGLGADNVQQKLYQQLNDQVRQKYQDQKKAIVQYKLLQKDHEISGDYDPLAYYVGNSTSGTTGKILKKIKKQNKSHAGLTVPDQQTQPENYQQYSRLITEAANQILRPWISPTFLRALSQCEEAGGPTNICIGQDFGRFTVTAIAGHDLKSKEDLMNLACAYMTQLRNGRVGGYTDSAVLAAYAGRNLEGMLTAINTPVSPDTVEVTANAASQYSKMRGIKHTQTTNPLKTEFWTSTNDDYQGTAAVGEISGKMIDGTRYAHRTYRDGTFKAQKTVEAFCNNQPNVATYVQAAQAAGQQLRNDRYNVEKTKYTHLTNLLQ